MDQEPKQQKRSPLVIVLIIIIVVLIAGAAVLALGKFGEKPAEEPLGDASTPLIGYEEGVTVVNDPDAFKKAVDEMYAKAADNGVPIEYNNNASSIDGETFECYIANPVHAKYDVYIQIFADAELTDQLYLSGLIPAGMSMQSISLDHPLGKGNHTVYVAYTQVEEDHATIHGQVLVTMDFSVE